MRAAVNHPRRGCVAFSLPELIVVLGLIMLLLGLLAPATSRAWRHAEAIRCRSQLRELGLALSAYANENRGIVYPMRGSSHDWPEILFDEPVPPVLVCPTWDEDFMSYQLNDMVRHGHIRMEGNNAAGLPASRIVLAGESRAGWMGGAGGYDYWTDTISWDPFRHGPGLLANYLWLDLHVDNIPPEGLPGHRNIWWVPRY